MGLRVGDKIPNFKAVDSLGEIFDSKTLIGKKPIVIYFYPKDDTPGCTIEACSFRDNYQDFKDLGAEVIGVSSDSVESHQNFKDKFNLPFNLLSDYNGQLRKLFGVPKDLLGLIPGRVTYIINREGVVEGIYRNLSGKNHKEKALEILKRT